jgi:uncharacterized integral membrane protein (TIGR00697 family)
VKLDAKLGLFITLVAMFMVCLVVGDLVGGKLTSFHLFGHEWVFSVGLLAFPVTFILTDIFNEFYGKAVTRRITILAFFMVGITLLILLWANAMPFWPRVLQDDWGGVQPRDFDRVFTGSMRIQLASMFAFLIANLVDIWVFFLFKKLTGNKMLWLRATGSTAVSQMIDTNVNNALVWGGRMTFDEYVTTVITSYAVKVAAAIAITPLIYGVHQIVEKGFKIPPAAPDVANADITK